MMILIIIFLLCVTSIVKIHESKLVSEWREITEDVLEKVNGTLASYYKDYKKVVG